MGRPLYSRLRYAKYIHGSSGLLLLKTMLNDHMIVKKEIAFVYFESLLLDLRKMILLGFVKHTCCCVSPCGHGVRRSCLRNRSRGVGSLWPTRRQKPRGSQTQQPGNCPPGQHYQRRALQIYSSTNFCCCSPISESVNPQSYHVSRLQKARRFPTHIHSRRR
jgi:hypothetical protein